MSALACPGCNLPIKIASPPPLGDSLRATTYYECTCGAYVHLSALRDEPWEAIAWYVEKSMPERKMLPISTDHYKRLAALVSHKKLE